MYVEYQVDNLGFRLQAERKRQRKHQLLSTIIPTTHKKPSIPARVEHFQSPSNKESMKIDDQVDKKKKILKREKDRSNGKKELFRKRAVTEVGPGSYSLDVKEKPSTRLLPCFASNTVRTYFDSLIFKTNVKEQV